MTENPLGADNNEAEDEDEDEEELCEICGETIDNCTCDADIDMEDDDKEPVKT